MDVVTVMFGDLIKLSVIIWLILFLIRLRQDLRSRCYNMPFLFCVAGALMMSFLEVFVISAAGFIIFWVFFRM